MMVVRLLGSETQTRCVSKWLLQPQEYTPRCKLLLLSHNCGGLGHSGRSVLLAPNHCPWSPSAGACSTIQEREPMAALCTV
jgi:hypothetical protein